MPDPEDVLRDSPVDFDSAVAYALHPEMRRLLILYVVGALLLPVGLQLFFGPPGVGGIAGMLVELLVRAFGLALAVVGAVALFGGLVGAAFKLVTDANLLAMAE